jgi:hypothetical protein
LVPVHFSECRLAEWGHREILGRNDARTTATIVYYLKTSARITKSEEMTTELVAEFPTPAVPPFVFIPWKQPIVPSPDLGPSIRG